MFVLFSPAVMSVPQLLSLLKFGLEFRIGLKGRICFCYPCQPIRFSLLLSHAALGEKWTWEFGCPRIKNQFVPPIKNGFKCSRYSKIHCCLKIITIAEGTKYLAGIAAAREYQRCMTMFGLVSSAARDDLDFTTGVGNRNTSAVVECKVPWGIARL